jgi:hypothetical protein
MREQWPFFRTRIDMLEMVLAKADAQIAEAYDERLVQPHLLPLGAHLRDLLSQACQVVLGLTGQSVLLAHSPTPWNSSACATPTSTRCIACRPSCWPARAAAKPLWTARWSRPAGVRGGYCRRVAQHRLRACPGHAWWCRAGPAQDGEGGCAGRNRQVSRKWRFLRLWDACLAAGAVYLEQPLTDFGHTRFSGLALSRIR